MGSGCLSLLSWPNIPRDLWEPAEISFGSTGSSCQGAVLGPEIWQLSEDGMEDAAVGTVCKKGECWRPAALWVSQVWIKGGRKVIVSRSGLQGGSTSCLKFLFFTLRSFCWRAHVLSSWWIFKHSRWSLKGKKTFQGLDICSTLHTQVFTNETDRMFYFKDVKVLSK